MASRSADERTILDMFSYMRPSGSKAEDAFVARFLAPLGFKRDAHDNLVLKIGPSPTILWSSHMDTVHRLSGIQTLHYDGTILALSSKAKRTGSTCLGADDTAGVWLMTEMIKAGVGGLYVIHHGEESGCIGSSSLAKSDPGFFNGIAAAIAFDRQDYADVITHQSWGRTASDAFAKSLSGILGGAYKPDDTGVYTDTNEYAGLVPECTNISVGYKGQHTQRETQNVPFLIRLRDTLVAADFSSLVIARDPAVDDSYAASRSGGKWFDQYDDCWNQDYMDSGHRYGGRKKSSSRLRYGTNVEGLLDIVEQYPDVIAELLEAYGFSRGELLDRVATFYPTPDEDAEDDDSDLPFSNTTSDTMRRAA